MIFKSYKDCNSYLSRKTEKRKKKKKEDQKQEKKEKEPFSRCS